MNKSHLKSFLRGSGISIVSALALGIMNYLIRKTISTNLSELDFGFFYSALALIMVALVFLDLGLGKSLTILLAKSFTSNNQKESSEIFTTTLIIKVLLSGIVLIALSCVSTPLCNHYFNYPGGTYLFIALALLIPAQSIETTFLAVFSARKAFATQSFFSNFKTILMLAGIVLFSGSHGLPACILCFVSASIVTGFCSFATVKHYGISFIPKSYSLKKQSRSILSLSSWIAISTAGLTAMYYMDTICLTWLQGLETVALYNIALPIMQIAYALVVFPLVFIPIASEMWQENNLRGIRHSCTIAAAMLSALIPFFLLIGIVFGDQIVTILFHERFTPVTPVVTALWIGMVFLAIVNFNVSALNSGGRQKQVALTICTSAIINIILNIIFIPKYGCLGAAIATGSSYVIAAIATLLLVYRATDAKHTNRKNEEHCA